MAAAPRLKLHGKPFLLRKPSPMAEKVKKILDHSPTDEIFANVDICRQAGVSLSHLRFMGQQGLIDGYVARAGKQLYYGNPKAIVSLAKMTAEGM